MKKILHFTFNAVNIFLTSVRTSYEVNEESYTTLEV